MDNTSIHPSCANQAHHIDLHLWRGAPQNLDDDRPIQILVNHGYVVGFCPDRLQPAWSAYRVAFADKDVDYDRPLMYYDDLRLDEAHRIGRRTFGKIGGIQLNVGHMSPNEVINRQFGRLAQMETFLMSNMSPQYGSLNSGVWLKLETAIREIKDEPGRDHVWAIVGPVFGDDPPAISRGRGKHLPIPEKYFCLLVDPEAYPYNTPSRVHIDCFLIPQDAPRDSNPQDYPATLSEIEQATQLKFFAAWGRDLPVRGTLRQSTTEAPSQSRVMQALQLQRRAPLPEVMPVAKASKDGNSVDELLEALRAEAAQIQIRGRALSDEEHARLKTIQQIVSWLLRARALTNPTSQPARRANFITYKVISDSGDRLKTAARTACNFWNRFLEPRLPIVLRLDTFTRYDNVIAGAYTPYEQNGVRYGRIDFNTRFLFSDTPERLAGTLIHEIGHTLGMGWEAWTPLFHHHNGLFKQEAIDQLAELANMEVERQGGAGTAYSHWDEDRFDQELMTGWRELPGIDEHVLPITIDVMALLGHQVIERLPGLTPLKDLIRETSGRIFSRQDEVQNLDLDYFEETELFETVPHSPAASLDADAKLNKN